MKNKIGSLVLVATLVLGAFDCQTTHAQIDTNKTEVLPSLAANPFPIPVSLDFITNLPSTTNFSTATIGLETGIATRNGEVANFIKGDGYFRTNWMVSLEIQNAPVSTVIDSISLYGGYRKSWSNAELYAEGGGRRTWATASDPPSWQGCALFGASWFPMTGGKVAVTGSVLFSTSPTGNIFQTAPGFEARAGVKLLF